MFTISLFLLLFTGGLAALFQRRRPALRLTGLALLALGLTGALWRHPVKADVERARSEGRRFCAAIADNLDAWQQAAGHGAARSHDAQSTQWDALSPVLTQAELFCAHDVDACGRLALRVSVDLATAASDEQHRTDVKAEPDVDAAIGTISMAIRNQVSCPRRSRPTGLR